MFNFYISQAVFRGALMLEWVVVFLLFLIFLVWAYYRGRISEIAMRRATELFNEWRERELEKQVEMRLKPELEK